MNRESLRDTWVDVSIDAIKENVKAFREHIKPSSKLLTVVKADGYGHGAVEIAKAAIDSGADGLGVALLDEALELRQAGFQVPILVLGYTKPEGIEQAVQENITLTVYSKDSIHAIHKACEKLNKRAKVHVKIDTGMTRIGLQTKEAALELIKMMDPNQIEIEGIYTHFADADNPDASYTQKQFNEFLEVTEYLEAQGFAIPIRHCCNSAGTIAYPKMHLDMCRVGISTYGLYPGEHLKEMIDLTQAMTFQTKPVQIKEVPAGQSISYGRTYTPDHTSVIATLPVGYADGFSRRLSNRGEVTVKGKRALIVGRICMDQAMIDITDIPEVTSDDIVTIFGDEHKGYVPLDEVADLLDTIHYEIVCLIGKRVPRNYV
jgi:alanine racemase